MHTYVVVVGDRCFSVQAANAMSDMTTGAVLLYDEEGALVAQVKNYDIVFRSTEDNKER